MSITGPNVPISVDTDLDMTVIAAETLPELLSYHSFQYAHIQRIKLEMTMLAAETLPELRDYYGS